MGTIEILREIRASHPAGYKILDAIRGWIRNCGDGDRTYREMEIARALYWVGALWHGGQWDVLYICQCGDYSPGMSETEPGGDEDDFCAGDDLYLDLCAILQS